MSILSSFQSFLQSKRGNVAPIFALAIIPVIGLTGAAVDYSRANSIKTAFQAALDSTALAMAKSASKLTETELQQKASDYFKAVFNRPEAKNVSIVATYSTTSGTQLTLTASGAMDTTFARVMGINELSIGSSSTIKWGNDRQRVALVLDTTGSMDSAGKIGALKTATKKLLDQLKAAASTDGDVLVSIIPFSKDVNVGSSGNGNASWLQFDDGTDRSWDGTNGTCNKGGAAPRSVCLAQASCSLSSYTSQGSCTSAGKCSNPGQTNQSDCTTKKACNKSQYTRKDDCEDSWGGNWGYGTWTAGAWLPAAWTPNNHSTWNGCITDRGSATAPGTTAGNDQTALTSPTAGDPTTLFYPEQYGSCSPQMKGLSSEWDNMKTLVDSFYADGSTNQGIGLVWGWQSLVGGGPLVAPAKSTNYTYRETIILLSDGMNTQNRWDGNGKDQSTDIDNRMYYNGVGTCKNITDKGITLYTIQVNTGTGKNKDPESAVLKACASPGKFVELTTADQMITTFEQIGKQLSQLRVAK